MNSVASRGDAHVTLAHTSSHTEKQRSVIMGQGPASSYYTTLVGFTRKNLEHIPARTVTAT